MKKFSIILLCCVIAISLLFSGTAYAQTEELTNPGITPDSPFYFLDVWGKKLGLFFTFGPEAKAKKALEITEERLAEAHIMAVKNKAKAVKVAANGYEEYVAIAIEKMNEARKKGVDISEVSEITALATSNHLLVWDGVEDIVPEEEKEAIAQAKGASINGLGNALRGLAGENPERAMEINLAAIEGRLNRANDEAEENNPEGVEYAVHEFVQLSGFSENISEMARGLSDNITVDQLVAKATSHHLDVLALVYGKVPGQAKPAIERAMARSIKGHERAVEALEAKGALPKGVSDNVTEGIMEELAAIMIARMELQKEATDLNRTGIDPALKDGDEVTIDIDGVVNTKTAAEWYEEAMEYLEDALAAYEAGDYAEAKEKAELAKDIFDAVNNSVGQTIGFWNLEDMGYEFKTETGKPEEPGPPEGKGKPKVLENEEEEDEEEE